MAANLSTVAEEASSRRPPEPRRQQARAATTVPDRSSAYWAVLGYGLASAAIVIGWLGRAERHIVAGDGLGYWLGIVGASAMGLLLLYPVRKKVRFMHRLGSTKLWFQAHIFLGVLGPILVLYHCNFELGSLNSRVALVCTLVVAVSGLAGRYLYSQVHLGLTGSRTNLRQLIDRARITSEQQRYASAFVPSLLERMNRYDRRVLEPPRSFLAAASLPLRLAFGTRLARFSLTRYARHQLRRHATTHSRPKAERKRLERVLTRFIAEHLRRVRRVATFGFYERMFSLWHLFHLPFFYILVFAALVHILAVHMY